MPPLMAENLHSLARSWVAKSEPRNGWLSLRSQFSRFRETTEDRQWIHVDSERAQRDSPYGTTIAYGFLTLALLSTSSGKQFRSEAACG